MKPERPRRQVRKNPLSEDFIDDKSLDQELEALESASLEVSFSKPDSNAIESVSGGGGGLHPRKRGRPRKHPPAPPPSSDEHVVKRPRGRPKGSGKHQRAAVAASTAGLLNAGGPADSNASAVGSSGMSIDPQDSDAIATPLMENYRGKSQPRETGTLTPHYPPNLETRPGFAGSDTIPGAIMYFHDQSFTNIERTTQNSTAKSSILETETPTPRPRNRRKCVAPRKTE